MISQAVSYLSVLSDGMIISSRLAIALKYYSSVTDFIESGRELDVGEESWTARLIGDILPRKEEKSLVLNGVLLKALAIDKLCSFCVHIYIN